MSLVDALVDAQAREAGWPKPEREYRYIPNRKLRADFAWPRARVLLEVQGGIFTRQAHGSVSGLLRDLERGNLAAVNGWRLIRVTPEQVQKGAVTHWLKLLSVLATIEAERSR